MDNVNSSAPARPDVLQEQAAYVPPAVIYEAPIEVRAGTTWPEMPDPLDLFGTKEN